VKLSSHLSRRLLNRYAHSAKLIRRPRTELICIWSVIRICAREIALTHRRMRRTTTASAKAASPLLPTGDAKKAALFEQAASIEVSNSDSSASGITAQRMFAPRRGLVTDDARMTELATTLEDKLATYEAILTKMRHFVSDELTLADLFLPSSGVYLASEKFAFLEDETKYTNGASRCRDVCLGAPVTDNVVPAGERRSPNSRPSRQKVKETNA
jgi:hypothetical protein